MTADHNASTARIVVEPELPGNPRSLFRVYMYGKVFAEGLTAAQAHVLVGDILETMVLPQNVDNRNPVTPRQAKS